MERKICHKCRNEKSVSEFYKDPSGKRGYRAVCKDCANERRRAKNWGRKRHSFKRGGNDARYWRVVYDPLDTFTNNSAFTKNEIIDMLNLEFLAIGTMFRHKRTGKMIMVGTNDKLVMVEG